MQHIFVYLVMLKFIQLMPSLIVILVLLSASVVDTTLLIFDVLIIKRSCVVTVTDAIMISLLNTREK